MRDPSFCQRKIIKFGFLSVLLLLPAASSQVCSADGTCENAARVPAKVIETISIEYGEPQVVLNHDSDITRTHIQQTQRYIMRHFSWKQTCLNRHHLCSFWAAIGECHKNELYMHKHCTASCQKCVVPDLEKPKVMESSQNDPQKGTTDNKTTPSSSSSSIITENSESAILVATSFGESQYVPTVNADPVVQNIAKSTTYMGRVLTEDHYAPVREECKNRHQKCSLWASEGECEKNKGYMTLHCAPSCGTCEQISYDYRCPYDKDAPMALNPGDLNRMFERIVADFPRYSPSILSSPNTTDGPWVLQFDTFLTDEECQQLIEQGQRIGYGQSLTVGKQNFDGTNEAVVAQIRTSTNAWCENECMDDPAVKEIHDRMEKLMQIPIANWEFLQLLKYEESQFYNKHHDYLEHHFNRPQGVRILTLFLYLNDVEGGGETRFSNLDINVAPRRGRAILWPSVLNEAPNVKDIRTEHEALTVTNGVKYGANAWVHQRDYRTPHNANCA